MRNNFLIRFFSSAILISFSFTSIVWPAPILTALPISYRNFNIANLTVPNELATIEEAFAGEEGKPSVILIQDAHCILDAQKNIAALIDHFQKENALQVVALEGGAGKLDPTLFRTFPDETIKQTVFDEYLKRGEISGPEWAAVLNKNRSQYWGVEDEALYQKNKESYFRAERQRANLEHELVRITRMFDEFKRELYSDELKKLDKLESDFKHDRGALEKLLAFLKQYESSETYPTITKLLAISDEDLKTNKEKLLAELAAEDLFQEMDQYIQAVGKKLATSSDAAELIDLYDKLDTLSDLIHLSMSRSDFEKYRLDRASFAPRHFQEFAEKYGKFIDLTFNLESHEEFYAIVLKRDEVMRKNVLRLLGKEEKGLAVFVAGGFHSAGITQELKKEGISYALLTPKIGVLPDQSPYDSVMKGEVSYKHFLNRQRDTLAPDLVFDDSNVGHAFIRGAGLRLVNSIDAANAENIFREWHDDTIRAVAEEGYVLNWPNHIRFIKGLLELVRRRANLEASPAFTEAKIQNLVEEVLIQHSNPKLDEVKKVLTERLHSFMDGVRSLVANNSLTESAVRSLLEESGSVPTTLPGTAVSPNVYPYTDVTSVLKSLVPAPPNLAVWAREQIKKNPELVDYFRNWDLTVAQAKQKLPDVPTAPSNEGVDAAVGAIRQIDPKFTRVQVGAIAEAVLEQVRPKLPTSTPALQDSMEPAVLSGFGTAAKTDERASQEKAKEIRPAEAERTENAPVLAMPRISSGFGAGNKKEDDGLREALQNIRYSSSQALQKKIALLEEQIRSQVSVQDADLFIGNLYMEAFRDIFSFLDSNDRNNGPSEWLLNETLNNINALSTLLKGRPAIRKAISNQLLEFLAAQLYVVFGLWPARGSVDWIVISLETLVDRMEGEISELVPQRAEQVIGDVYMRKLSEWLAEKPIQVSPSDRSDKYESEKALPVHKRKLEGIQRAMRKMGHLDKTSRAEKLQEIMKYALDGQLQPLEKLFSQSDNLDTEFSMIVSDAIKQIETLLPTDESAKVFREVFADRWERLFTLLQGPRGADGLRMAWKMIPYLHVGDTEADSSRDARAILKNMMTYTMPWKAAIVGNTQDWADTVMKSLETKAREFMSAKEIKELVRNAKIGALPLLTGLAEHRKWPDGSDAREQIKKENAVPVIADLISTALIRLPELSEEQKQKVYDAFSFIILNDRDAGFKKVEHNVKAALTSEDFRKTMGTVYLAILPKLIETMTTLSVSRTETEAAEIAARLVRKKVIEYVGPIEGRNKMREIVLAGYPEMLERLKRHAKPNLLALSFHEPEETYKKVASTIISLVDHDGAIGARLEAKTLSPWELLGVLDYVAEGRSFDDGFVDRLVDTALWMDRMGSSVKSASRHMPYATLLKWRKGRGALDKLEMMRLLKHIVNSLFRERGNEPAFPWPAGHVTLKNILDRVGILSDLLGKSAGAVFGAGSTLPNPFEQFTSKIIEREPDLTPDRFAAYLDVIIHILTQVRVRQPQATDFDLPNEDDKLAITNFLLAHVYDPARLKAVFDIYFNSGDLETYKQIDQFDMKFSRKNPGAFYQEMSDHFRQIHRQQTRKLDYNFFIPFMLNLVDPAATSTYPEAEVIFKLFTSKKLHGRRDLKTSFRIKADLFDAKHSPEQAALFRKGLRVLNRKWHLGSVASNALNERIRLDRGGEDYLSFAAARSATDVIDLFIDLSSVGRKKKDPSQKDFALEWMPRILQRMDEVVAVEEESLPRAYAKFEQAAAQFKYFYKSDKVNVLYSLFAPHAPETKEAQTKNRTAFIRYGSRLPINQDGKTVFDSMVEFIQSNTNRGEVVTVMREALLKEAGGEFKAWRYASSDYQKMFGEWVKRQKEVSLALASRESPEKRNELEQKLEAELNGRVQAIRAAWEGNQYYVTKDPSADRNLYVGFTDNFSTLLNLGNPSYFGSCQACYKPAYNRGLAGTVSNGWNKAVVIYDEKGQFLARRVVRLRLSSGGELVVLKEPIYGDSGFSNLLDRALAKVASDMGVRYQPDMGESLEALNFYLWRGHSEWDYSDTYGKQFAEDVGLVRIQGDAELVANYSSPLVEPAVNEMGPGFEAVDESFFRLIAERTQVDKTSSEAEVDIKTSIPLRDYLMVGNQLYFRGVPVHSVTSVELNSGRFKEFEGEYDKDYGSLYIDKQNQVFRKTAGFGSEVGETEPVLRKIYDALRESGYQTLQQVFEASLKSENLLGTGRLYTVYSIPGVTDYALRFLKDSLGSVKFSEKLNALDDPLPDLNVGQAIAQSGDIQIVKRQKGIRLGAPFEKRFSPDASSDRIYERNLGYVAALPSRSYDDFAQLLSSLRRRGFVLDAGDPSNVLLDVESGTLNVVDLHPVESDADFHSSLAGMINVLLNNPYAQYYKAGRKDIVWWRQFIIGKSISAATRAGLPVYPSSKDNQMFERWLRSAFESAQLDFDSEMTELARGFGQQAEGETGTPSHIQVIDESTRRGRLLQFQNVHGIEDLLAEIRSSIEKLRARGEMRPLKILDLGSGAQMILLRIIKEEFGDQVEIVGVDPETSVGVPGYREGDGGVILNQMVKAQEKFDVILSHRALAFFKDPLGALERVRAILSPGGWASIHIMQPEKILKGGAKSIAEWIEAPGIEVQSITGKYYFEAEFGDNFKPKVEDEESPLDEEPYDAFESIGVPTDRSFEPTTAIRIRKSDATPEISALPKESGFGSVKGMQSSPELPRFSNRKFVAYELLEALTLTGNPAIKTDFEVVGKQKGANDSTVIRIRINRPDPEAKNLARGTEVFYRELAPTRLFDLLYSQDQHLIAVFPVTGKISEDQLLPRYFDFSPYYLNVPRIGDRNAQRKWARFAESYSENQKLIQHYIEKNKLDIAKAYEQYAPFVYVEFNRKSFQASFTPFYPGQFDKSLARRVLDHEEKDQIILPVFPTVYSPAGDDHMGADAGYYDRLYRGDKFKLSVGQRALLIGPGTGIDTWLVWLKTGKLVHTIGINPLEIANVRATARIANFPVKAKQHDNIIDASGKPVFRIRFDRVLWNMPRFVNGGAEIVFEDAERVEQGKRSLRTLWDGDMNGLALQRFAVGLPKVLKANGESLVWNGYETIHGENPVIERFQRLGFNVNVLAFDEKWKVGVYRLVRARSGFGAVWPSAGQALDWTAPLDRTIGSVPRGWRKAEHKGVDESARAAVVMEKLKQHLQSIRPNWNAERYKTYGEVSIKIEEKKFGKRPSGKKGFAVFPSDEFLSRLSEEDQQELSALKTKIPKDSFYPPLGSLGQVFLYSTLIAGRPAVIILETQPSDGFRNLNRRVRRALRKWSAETARAIGEWGEKNNVLLFAMSDKMMGSLYPSMREGDDLKDYYRWPFLVADGGLWREENWLLNMGKHRIMQNAQWFAWKGNNYSELADAASDKEYWLDRLFGQDGRASIELANLQDFSADRDLYEDAFHALARSLTKEDLARLISRSIESHKLSAGFSLFIAALIKKLDAIEGFKMLEDYLLTSNVGDGNLEARTGDKNKVRNIVSLLDTFYAHEVGDGNFSELVQILGEFRSRLDAGSKEWFNDITDMLRTRLRSAVAESSQRSSAGFGSAAGSLNWIFGEVDKEDQRTLDEVNTFLSFELARGSTFPPNTFIDTVRDAGRQLVGAHRYAWSKDPKDSQRALAKGQIISTHTGIITVNDERTTVGNELAKMFLKRLIKSGFERVRILNVNDRGFKLWNRHGAVELHRTPTANAGKFMYVLDLDLEEWQKRQSETAARGFGAQAGTAKQHAMVIWNEMLSELKTPEEVFTLVNYTAINISYTQALENYVSVMTAPDVSREAQYLEVMTVLRNKYVQRAADVIRGIQARVPDFNKKMAIVEKTLGHYVVYDSMEMHTLRLIGTDVPETVEKDWNMRVIYPAAVDAERTLSESGITVSAADVIEMGFGAEEKLDDTVILPKVEESEVVEWNVKILSSKEFYESGRSIERRTKERNPEWREYVVWLDDDGKIQLDEDGKIKRSGQKPLAKGEVILYEHLNGRIRIAKRTDPGALTLAFIESLGVFNERNQEKPVPQLPSPGDTADFLSIDAEVDAVEPQMELKRTSSLHAIPSGRPAITREMETTGAPGLNVEDSFEALRENLRSNPIKGFVTERATEKQVPVTVRLAKPEDQYELASEFYFGVAENVNTDNETLVLIAESNKGKIIGVVEIRRPTSIDVDQNIPEQAVFLTKSAFLVDTITSRRPEDVLNGIEPAYFGTGSVLMAAVGDFLLRLNAGAKSDQIPLFLKAVPLLGKQAEGDLEDFYLKLRMKPVSPSATNRLYWDVTAMKQFVQDSISKFNLNFQGEAREAVQNPAAGFGAEGGGLMPADFGSPPNTKFDIGGTMQYPITPGSTIEVRKIQTQPVPIHALKRFALANSLTFQIVPRGRSAEGFQPALQKPARGGGVAAPAAGYILQVWLDGKPVNLDEVNIEDGVPIIIKRGLLPRELDPNLHVDLEGDKRFGTPIRRKDYSGIQGDRERRMAIFWLENGLTKTVYLPRRAYSTGPSRGVERSTKRPGYDLNTGQFLSGYLQTGHLQIEILGDSVVFSDLGSTGATQLEVSQDWFEEARARIDNTSADQGELSRMKGLDLESLDSVEGLNVIDLLPGDNIPFSYSKPFNVAAILHHVEIAKIEVEVRGGKFLYVKTPGETQWRPMIENRYVSEEPIPVAGQESLFKRGIDASQVMGAYHITFDPSTQKITVENFSASRLRITFELEPGDSMGPAGFGAETKLSGPEAVDEALAYLKEKANVFEARRAEILRYPDVEDEDIKVLDDIDEKVFILRAIDYEIKIMAEKKLYQIARDVLDVAATEDEGFEKTGTFYELYEQLERIAIGNGIIQPAGVVGPNGEEDKTQNESGFGSVAQPPLLQSGDYLVSKFRTGFLTLRKGNLVQPGENIYLVGRGASEAALEIPRSRGEELGSFQGLNFEELGFRAIYIRISSIEEWKKNQNILHFILDSRRFLGAVFIEFEDDKIAKESFAETLKPQFQNDVDSLKNKETAANVWMSNERGKLPETFNGFAISVSRDESVVSENIAGIRNSLSVLSTRPYLLSEGDSISVISSDAEKLGTSIQLKSGLALSVSGTGLNEFVESELRVGAGTQKLLVRFSREEWEKNQDKVFRKLLADQNYAGHIFIEVEDFQESDLLKVKDGLFRLIDRLILHTWGLDGSLPREFAGFLIDVPTKSALTRQVQIETKVKPKLAVITRTSRGRGTGFGVNRTLTLAELSEGIQEILMSISSVRSMIESRPTRFEQLKIERLDEPFVHIRESIKHDAFRWETARRFLVSGSEHLERILNQVKEDIASSATVEKKKRDWGLIESELGELGMKVYEAKEVVDHWIARLDEQLRSNIELAAQEPVEVSDISIGAGFGATGERVFEWPISVEGGEFRQFEKFVEAWISEIHPHFPADEFLSQTRTEQSPKVTLYHKKQSIDGKQGLLVQDITWQHPGVIAVMETFFPDNEQSRSVEFVFSPASITVRVMENEEEREEKFATKEIPIRGIRFQKDTFTVLLSSDAVSLLTPYLSKLHRLRLLKEGQSGFGEAAERDPGREFDEIMKEAMRRPSAFAPPAAEEVLHKMELRETFVADEGPDNGKIYMTETTAGDRFLVFVDEFGKILQVAADAHPANNFGFIDAETRMSAKGNKFMVLSGKLHGLFDEKFRLVLQRAKRGEIEIKDRTLEYGSVRETDQRKAKLFLSLINVYYDASRLRDDFISNVIIREQVRSMGPQIFAAFQGVIKLMKDSRLIKAGAISFGGHTMYDVHAHRTMNAFPLYHLQMVAHEFTHEKFRLRSEEEIQALTSYFLEKRMEIVRTVLSNPIYARLGNEWSVNETIAQIVGWLADGNVEITLQDGLLNFIRATIKVGDIDILIKYGFLPAEFSPTEEERIRFEGKEGDEKGNIDLDYLARVYPQAEENRQISKQMKAQKSGTKAEAQNVIVDPAHQVSDSLFSNATLFGTREISEFNRPLLPESSFSPARPKMSGLSFKDVEPLFSGVGLATLEKPFAVPDFEALDFKIDFDPKRFEELADVRFDFDLGTILEPVIKRVSFVQPEVKLDLSGLDAILKEFLARMGNRLLQQDLAKRQQVIRVEDFVHWLEEELINGRQFPEDVRLLFAAVVQFQGIVDEVIEQNGKRDEFDLLPVRSDADIAQIDDARVNLEDVIDKLERAEGRDKGAVEGFRGAILNRAHGYQSKLNQEYARRLELPAGFGLEAENLLSRQIKEELHVNSVETQRYTVNNQEIAVEITDKFIRIAEFAFVHPEEYEQLSDIFKEKFARNIIQFPEGALKLRDGRLFFNYHNYVLLTILAMTGYRDRVRNKIVLDLGAGGGLLTFLALRLGARRVVAVEGGEDQLEIARSFAGKNGFSEGEIEFVNKYLLDLDDELSREEDIRFLQDRNIQIAVANVAEPHDYAQVMLENLPTLEYYFFSGQSHSVELVSQLKAFESQSHPILEIANLNVPEFRNLASNEFPSKETHKAITVVIQAKPPAGFGTFAHQIGIESEVDVRALIDDILLRGVDVVANELEIKLARGVDAEFKMKIRGLSKQIAEVILSAQREESHNRDPSPLSGLRMTSSELSERLKALNLGIEFSSDELKTLWTDLFIIQSRLDFLSQPVTKESAAAIPVVDIESFINKMPDASIRNRAVQNVRDKILEAIRTAGNVSGSAVVVYTWETFPKDRTGILSMAEQVAKSVARGSAGDRIVLFHRPTDDLTPLTELLNKKNESILTNEQVSGLIEMVKDKRMYYDKLSPAEVNQARNLNEGLSILLKEIAAVRGNSVSGINSRYVMLLNDPSVYQSFDGLSELVGEVARSLARLDSVRRQAGKSGDINAGLLEKEILDRIAQFGFVAGHDSKGGEIISFNLAVFLRHVQESYNALIQTSVAA